MKVVKKIDDFINDKNKKIMKILNIKKNYNIKLNDNYLIDLYDNNDKIISGKYNFYGIYQPYTKLWIWASSIPGISQKHIKQIDKLKSFSYLFENENDEKSIFYYQLLTQNVILITDNKLIKWIGDLIIYLSNDLYMFNPSNNDGNIQFLSLVNIKNKLI